MIFNSVGKRDNNLLLEISWRNIKKDLLEIKLGPQKSKYLNLIKLLKKIL